MEGKECTTRLLAMHVPSADCVVDSPSRKSMATSTEGLRRVRGLARACMLWKLPAFICVFGLLVRQARYAAQDREEADSLLAGVPDELRGSFADMIKVRAPRAPTPTPAHTPMTSMAAAL